MYKFENKDAKSRTVVIVAVVALALLVTLGICGIVSLFKDELTTYEEKPSAGLVFDESAVEGGWENLSQEEIEAALKEKVQEGMINISMNTAPYFADGQAEGNVMIVNELINNYPQQVEIVRNDTEELLYRSGAIAVGSKIERAKLLVDLDAGTYDCTAYFHNLNDDGEIIGTAGAIITITIKE